MDLPDRLKPPPMKETAMPSQKCTLCLALPHIPSPRAICYRALCSSMRWIWDYLEPINSFQMCACSMTGRQTNRSRCCLPSISIQAWVWSESPVSFKTRHPTTPQTFSRPSLMPSRRSADLRHTLTRWGFRCGFLARMLSSSSDVRLPARRRDQRAWGARSRH